MSEDLEQKTTKILESIAILSNLNTNLKAENESLKQQLSVALVALNKIDKDCTEYDGYRSSAIAREAIQQIEGS